MALPKGYLPKEGDILDLRGKVKYSVDADDKDVHLVIAGQSYRPVVVPLAEIVDIYCRAWEPGDKVRFIDTDSLIGEVVAICDDQVWVKFIAGGMGTYAANDLEPQSEQVEPAILSLASTTKEET